MSAPLVTMASPATREADMPIVKVIHAYEDVVVDIVWQFKDGTFLRKRRTPPPLDVRNARQTADESTQNDNVV